MSNYIVYIHTNNTNGKKYVGITCQSPNRRWRNGNGYYENEHFYRAIQKYGWDNFTHEIYRAGLTKKQACEIEMALIAKYKSNDPVYGYNKSSGGEMPCSGVKMSEATRRKMSEAHKAVVFTEEAKKNMSIAAKKRGNNLKGRFGADSQRAGLLKQIDAKTNQVIAEYRGYCEMERITGFNLRSIQRAARGEQEMSHGYKWEYISKGVLNVITN
jgi:group I intron endonuclease